nr:hypothetical protein CPAG_00047 [Coccidioides posadasii RMSCC 3488]
MAALGVMFKICSYQSTSQLCLYPNPHRTIPFLSPPVLSNAGDRLPRSLHTFCFRRRQQAGFCPVPMNDLATALQKLHIDLRPMLGMSRAFGCISEENYQRVDSQQQKQAPIKSAKTTHLV